MVRIYKQEGHFCLSDGEKLLYDPVLLIERLAVNCYSKMEKTYPDMPTLVSDLSEDENRKLGRSIWDILMIKGVQANEEDLKKMHAIDEHLYTPLLGGKNGNST